MKLKKNPPKLALATSMLDEVEEDGLITVGDRQIGIREMVEEAKKRSLSGVKIKYSRELCDAALEVISNGYGEDALPGLLMVTKGQIEKWAAEHEEFKEALEIARGIRSYRTYKELDRMRKTNTGNAGLMAMQANAWTDLKVETNKDIQKIATQVTIDSPRVANDPRNVATESTKRSIEKPEGY